MTANKKTEKKSLTRLASTAAMMLVLSGCQTVSDMEDGSTQAATLPKKTVEKPLHKDKAAKTVKAEKKKKVRQKAIVQRPDDLWERIRLGMGMDLNNNHPWIMTELEWYAKNQGYFNRVADRSAPYLYFIIKEAEARGVPLELALMPVVESAYDPFAYSHAGASGLWQFMPGTGEDYGLDQNWWYDGRRDVVAATRAALDYMVRLNNAFGDWELALAAFNSGPGRVQRAVNKNRREGKPITFWDLDLPRETTAYVPKLIALGKIVRNPGKYGIKLKPIDNQPYFAKVSTGGQLDMAKAARIADTPLDELYRLNPGLNRWATPPEGPHHLLVPIKKAETFNKALVELPQDQRLRWKRYTVKSGDSLIRIAKKYDTRASLIREVNQMEGNMIRIGQSLLIPVPAKGREDYALTANQRRLAQQNSNVSGRYRVDYTVKSGDSFWTIARQFSVGVNELARWNNMSPRDTLRIGQELAVWSKGSASADSVIRKVNYTVRAGDSLSLIADKFNINVSQIELWNSFDSKYIHPGQMLTLYVDVTRAYD